MRQKVLPNRYQKVVNPVPTGDADFTLPCRRVAAGVAKKASRGKADTSHPALTRKHED